MKGLIIKDLYVLKTYGIIYVLPLLIFAAVLVFKGTSLVCLMPCVLMGMLPSSLHALDESVRWLQYSACLPYTRSQIVSVKYIMALILNFGATLVLTVGSIINILLVSRDFSQFACLPMWAALYLSAGTFGSLCLPFIFWLGAEKGRYVYMVFGGLMGASFGIIGSSSKSINSSMLFNMPVIIATIFAVAAALFGVSWAASIAMFKRRQL